LGFQFSVFGFRVSGSGVRVYGVGFVVDLGADDLVRVTKIFMHPHTFEFRVSGSDLGLRVLGVGMRVARSLGSNRVY